MTPLLPLLLLPILVKCFGTPAAASGVLAGRGVVGVVNGTLQVQTWG